MQNTNLEEIKKQAIRFQESGLKWHFHILAPNCILNDRDEYALVLETPDQKALVHYSDKAEKDLGVILVKLLHGTKILQPQSSSTISSLNPKIELIYERINDLNDKGIEWHHHCLFPECKFNKSNNLYQLIFEDPDSGEVSITETENEPTNELSLIESLFL